MTKKARQANLFPVDIDAVWKRFLAMTDWESVDIEAERQAMSESIAQLERDIDEMQNRRSVLLEQQEALSDRELMARKHLENASEQMGAFGTEAVLLASLQEAFPPTLAMRTTVRTRSEFETQQAPKGRQQSASPKPEASPSVLESILLENLDYDGMKAGQLLKLLRKMPGLEDITSKELSKGLSRLADKGQIVISGENRGKTYSLSTGSDQ